MSRLLNGTLIGTAESSMQEQVRQALSETQVTWGDPVRFFGSKAFSGRFQRFSEDALNKTLRQIGLQKIHFEWSPFEGTSTISLTVTDGRMRGAVCWVFAFEVSISPTIADFSLQRTLDYSDRLAASLEIASGSVHDLENMSEQNQIGVQYFKAIGKKLPPERVKFSATFQEDIVDLEQNPSHIHVVGPIDYTAAWTNYIGPDFLNSIGLDMPPEDLSVYSMKQLKDHLFRITLFEDPFECEAPMNVKRMWEFRKKMRIDDTAHRFVTIY